MTNPAREALNRAVSKAIENGAPIYTNQPARTFRVFMNSVSVALHSDETATATYRAAPVSAFEGDAFETANYLESIPQGVSVEVREYHEGVHKGARSCMNKRALWESLRNSSSVLTRS